MIAVPAAIPDTMPVLPSTTRTPPNPVLLHVPPGAASLRLVEKPAHMRAVPVIEAGSGSTVTVAAIRQPVGNV